MITMLKIKLAVVKEVQWRGYVVGTLTSVVTSGEEVNDREAQEEEEGGSRRTRRQTVKIYVRE